MAGDRASDGATGTSVGGECTLVYTGTSDVSDERCARDALGVGWRALALALAVSGGGGTLPLPLPAEDPRGAPRDWP